ncbi:unnamed protein product [Peronospora effusa]|uniref:Uncharacterized protein n=1 Tax=Peronospora effusa TaxID=542832 RepID=A0A3M6VK47_9STRA|nr:hypothetical protein DD238_003021 [Peronospora effusa]RQM15211.1 hypothetical protein DD237_002704 [Peronospora effusa]CAI5700441.1 unnamed protein product [Peronospora effusa]
MSLSSDSDSDTGKRKCFKIGSSGTPVRWNGDDWTFYKHAMINAFEESLLDQIAIGKETLDDTWNAEQKGEFKKKQAKIKILIYRIAFDETCEASDDERDRHGDVVRTRIDI